MLISSSEWKKELLLIFITDEKPQKKGGGTGSENGKEIKGPLKIWHGPPRAYSGPECGLYLVDLIC